MPIREFLQLLCAVSRINRFFYCISEITFSSHRRACTVVSLSETKQAGHSPADVSTIVAMDVIITAVVSGIAVMLVRMKYLGNVWT